MTKIKLKNIDLDQLSSIIMMMATLLALAISNTRFSNLYTGIIHMPISLGIGKFTLALSFGEWVKDLLMSIFFLKIALELKIEFYEGSLKSPKHVVLPLIATLGGVVFPAVFYCSVNMGNPENLAGFAIPCATDIAFAMCIFKLVAKKFSNSIRIFLLSIAIFDDLIAMIIIAFFYNNSLNPFPLFYSCLIILLMFYLHHKKVGSLIPYIILSIFLWIGFYFGGIHTTMSGVVLGAFIPIYSIKTVSPLKRLNDFIHHWVNFLILPLFAFVASGVAFLHLEFKDLLHPIPLGVMLGLFVGKQIGIFLCTWGAVKYNIAHMPQNSRWFEVYGVSVLAGIGFTMSLFMSFLAFDDIIKQDLAKIGVIFSSLITIIYGYFIIKLDSKKQA